MAIVCFNRVDCKFQSTSSNWDCVSLDLSYCLLVVADYCRCTFLLVYHFPMKFPAQGDFRRRSRIDFSCHLWKSRGTLVLLAMFLIGLTLYTGVSWLWVMDNTGYWTLRITERTLELVKVLHERIEGKRIKRGRDTIIKEEIEKVINRPPPRIEPIISELPPSKRIERESKRIFSSRQPIPFYHR